MAGLTAQSEWTGTPLKALFAEVLEHVTFHSPAIDRDEGLLHYGWEGEDVFNTVDFDTEVTTVPRAEGSAAESPRRGPQRPAMEVDGAAVDELMQESCGGITDVDYALLATSDDSGNNFFIILDTFLF